MSTRGDILRRAAQVEPDAVPEPWGPSDDEDALATVSDREHYRKNLVTLPDGAGEVPAYVWDFPRTPTIPDEVREEWTRGSAGRVLGTNGKYVSRGSDVPRLSYDGEDPGLLVEAAVRTNQCTDSSDISQWDLTGGKNGVSVSSATSILKGKTAHKVTSGGAASDNARQGIAGTFSGSDETYYIKVEKGTSDLIQLAVLNLASTNFLFSVKYEWSTGTLTVVNGSVADKRVRVQQSSGPNGGKQIHFLVRVAGGNAENVNGEDRRLQVYPDANGNGNDTYFHHAQIEEAPNASSPIVTGGSPTTRSADDYSVFTSTPSWFNSSEGSYFVEFVPMAHTTVGGPTMDILANQNSGYFFFGDEEPPYSISANDSNNFVSINNTASSFSTSKLGISFDSTSYTLSVNGSSKNASHNGNMLDGTETEIARKQSLLEVNRLIYYPRALPESTLNTLTS